MNLLRSYEFFQPGQCDGRIHIIGCGAVGSALAEQLIRLGITKITIYDDDAVESHNVTNQLYRQIDIGKQKVDALFEMLADINPEITEKKSGFKVVNGKYVNQKLSGYVFLCVDNIDTRREICTNNRFNNAIKGMFDFRVSLSVGQHFAARWDRVDDIEWLLETMDFSHEEAKAEEPVSACNSPLSVSPTIRNIVTLGAANFMNFVKKEEFSKMIVSHPFVPYIEMIKA